MEPNRCFHHGSHWSVFMSKTLKLNIVKSNDKDSENLSEFVARSNLYRF